MLPHQRVYHFAALIALAVFLCVGTGSVRAAAPPYPINHYQTQTTHSVGGSPSPVTYMATVELLASSGGSNVTFGVSVWGVYSTNDPPTDATLRIGLNNGSTTVYGSGGKINLGGGGVYEVVIEVNYAGSWQNVAPSGPPRMTVALPKATGFQTRVATVDATYKFYDHDTGKLITSVFVAAGDSPFLNLSNTGSVDYVVTTQGKVWNSSTEHWEDSLTDETIASGSINQGQMSSGFNWDGGGTIGPSTTGNGANAFADNVGSVKVMAPTGGLVSSTNTSAATGQEQATNTNAIVNAIYDASGKIVGAVAKGQQTGAVFTGGGGGGTTTGNVTVTNLSTVTGGKTLADVNTSVGALGTLLRPASNPHETPANDLSASQTAAAAVAPYDGPSAAFTDSPSVGTPSGSVSNDILAVHSGAFNVTAGFSSFYGKSLLESFRQLIVYALAIGFIGWCGVALHSYLVHLPMIPQAEGNVGVENLVPGMAQAKSLGAAGIMVLAIVAAAAALVIGVDTWANNTGGVHVTEVLSKFASSSSLPSGLELVDRVYPVYVSLQFVLLRAAFHYAAVPLYLTCASLLKFIKA